MGGITLDTTKKRKEKSSILSYIPPENIEEEHSPKDIIKEERGSEKSNVWSLGCILYELAFKKPAFWNVNNKIIISNITGLNYNLPDDCEKDLKTIIPKLICEESKRLTIKDIFLEGTIKNKIIEINLFPEIVKGDEQGK